MLIGEYTHTVDAKNRISLPAKFRKELGNRVVVTNGLDSCLFIFSLKTWSIFSGELGKLSLVQGDKRKFTRFMLGGASEVEVDSIGRILIPDFLKEFAKLKNKVVLAGVHTRVEIWSEKNWTDYKKGVEKDIDVLAEKLGEVGALN
ncbi:MAG: division/cell wall cluster transcriptional repressor MraZ [Patescibacteria group bacterium]